MRNDLTVKDLTLIGLLTALVTVATMIIQIPISAGYGYIHMGDSMIFLTAILFGRRKAAFAGGIGSAIADLLSGYGQYAIPTLIIKGFMGYIVGTIADQESQGLFAFRNLLALAVGIVIMAGGYLITNTLMYGEFMAALVGGFPSDLLQGFGGAALFMPIGLALKKTIILKGIQNH
ncbi:ECF transporter S component [Alkaliphilus serpentinus]|uniref:ECF transporter S component n=1 Tax=Alkaliphilus serpentinus TaxID=1482731 RepID=A0A833HP52_9FIRM|nr:ECF transporter S component [Alkaliphilus serpentinus]KAB3530445.1 ECF transporter S component [Alkaliphilus serpentinus]